MDFRLAPLHSEPEDPPTPRPQPAQTAPKELLKLIKDLSAGEGLEQLFSSTPTKNSFRYCNYKERSDFLRGLTLNFPNITTLHRSVGFIGPCGIFCFNQLNPVFYLFLFRFIPPSFCLQFGSECGGPNHLGSGNLKQTREGRLLQTQDSLCCRDSWQCCGGH